MKRTTANAALAASFLAVLSVGCGSDADGPVDDGSGGGQSGGNTASGGVTSTNGGVANSGGVTSSGGTAGTANTGGASNGGASNGGASNGGASNGGASSAGGSANTGGASSGGTSNTGGASSSGGSAGSSNTGGSGSCDLSDPPADVAAWVNESWNAQLGNNIRSRKAWNLDNVMLNKGKMNLCVRWGATSAVTSDVHAKIEPTVQRWFNDWFKGLGNYGCFPYGAGIEVKITGWAVKKGKESLLGDVDPSIPVYTETDGDGEPKCPDACSSFVHWDHNFANCPGGDAKHSDYWLWFDDNLPGGGGAAAVGGDWGLRMPVSTFTGHLNDTSFSICEHEMGHGFGIQDYYDWTGSKPAGGSIMIVGSTRSQPPTTADIWLLKRTWKEMKTLRGW